MGIDISLLSLPENCSLWESALRSEEDLNWITHIPAFLEVLEGGHPSLFFKPNNTRSGYIKSTWERFHSPYFASFREVWTEYIRLCEKHPGLEARYCESSKDWLRLTYYLPDREITLNGSSFDLPFEAVTGYKPLSEDREHRYHPAENVFEIAAYLNPITVQQIGLSYRESCSGHSWSEANDRELGYLKDHFIRLQAFYNASAEHGEVVLVSKWG